LSLNLQGFYIIQTPQRGLLATHV